MSTTDYPHAGQAAVIYLEGSAFLGQRSAYCCGYEGQSAFWPNTAYFCPQCGEIWARTVLDFKFDYKPLPRGSWVIEHRACVPCGDGQLLIGQESRLDACDEGLIRREFNVLIQGVSNGNIYASCT